MNSIHELELQLIQALQQFRTTGLDSLFLLANFLDTSAFYYSVMAIAFLFGRRLGVAVFYLSMATFVLNAKLKMIFALPRPCQIDPSVGLLCFDSYGFPSGAAQAAVSIMGFIAFYFRRTGISLFAILYIIFVCISRVYLGVHFFTDILGGIFFGGMILSVYIALEHRVRDFLSRSSFLAKLTTALIVPLCFYIVQPKYIQVPLIVLGVNIGLLFKEPNTERHFQAKAATFAVGIVGYFVSKILVSSISTFGMELLTICCEKVFLGFYFCYLMMKIASYLPCCKTVDTNL